MAYSGFDGIIIAFSSLFIIGIFHPIVIKGEYYFSEKIWPVFLVAGLLLCVLSVFTRGIVSVILALAGSACLWSIKELKEQTKRVEKGWFPKNERRKDNMQAKKENGKIKDEKFAEK
ncbi:DUF4491 family protein [uncultured Treponema sp.]|uniref:DUF4491 family protein n=1 Tax=uncultured Treponema sp. TaxID=162155 RepID=UPI0025CF6013|nr:DUF4491 family protein [uncultured Treponema sp.]